MIVVSDTSPLTTPFIPSLRDVLSEMESRTTFFLSEEIKNLALKRAAEL
jgi:hypothetical protein